MTLSEKHGSGEQIRNVKIKSSLPVREVPGTNLDQKTGYHEIFRDFQADAGTAPLLRPFYLTIG
jgi:hypothetical protein